MAGYIDAVKDLVKQKVYVVVVEVWNADEKWLIINHYRSQGTGGHGCPEEKFCDYVQKLKAMPRYSRHSRDQTTMQS